MDKRTKMFIGVIISIVTCILLFAKKIFGETIGNGIILCTTLLMLITINTGLIETINNLRK